MNNEYRFIFEKGSRKYFCPDCNKKRFVRYIDTKTGEYLPEQYGRCDREANCGYHLNPYQDGYTKMIWDKENGNSPVIPIRWKPPSTRKAPLPPAKPVYFNFEAFKRTLRPEYYENNIFIQNLFNRVPYPFDPADVTKVIEFYRLGTIPGGYRSGAVTFPFIDIDGNVRAVQVKQFDETNHTTGTDFLHSVLAKHYNNNGKPQPKWLEAYMNQDKKVSCLFGEHLLNEFPSNRIALVEAPKTAIYGTLYFGLPETPDQYLWIAVYNKSSFSLDKVKPLQGRFVDVFPDLSKDGGTFNEWKSKAKEYQSKLSGTRFIFSDLLEKLAGEEDKQAGNDLADILIKLDWRQFRKQEAVKPIEVTAPDPIVVSEIVKPKPHTIKEDKPKVLTNTTKSSYWTRWSTGKSPDNWDERISKLKAFFNSIELPTDEIRLSQCEIITDIQKFIDTHLIRIEQHNGNMTFEPYLLRLEKLKNILSV